MQGSGLLPAANTSGSSSSRSLLRWSGRQRRHGRHDDRFGRFDLHALDFLEATSASHDLIERSTHVLYQVEPVRNLHSVRRTTPSSISIRSYSPSDSSAWLGSNGNTEVDLFDRTALVKEHAYNRALGKQSMETMPLINDAVTEGANNSGAFSLKSVGPSTSQAVDSYK
jgi:hypothetical protein